MRLSLLCAVAAFCALPNWAAEGTPPVTVDGTFPDGGEVLVQPPGQPQPKPLVTSDTISSGTRVVSTKAVVQMSQGTRALLAFQADGSVRVLVENDRVILEIPDKVNLRLATFTTTPKGLVAVRPRRDVLCEPDSGTDFVVNSTGETVAGGAVETRWEAGPDGLEAGSLRVAAPKYFPFPVGSKRQEPQDVAKVELERLTAELPLRYGDRVISTPILLEANIPARTVGTVPSGGGLGGGGGIRGGSFGKPGIDPPERRNITP